MKKRTEIMIAAWLAMAVVFDGCAIKILPEVTSLPLAKNPPIVRLGEVTETMTGTWEIYPEFGWKSAFVEVMRSKEMQSYFSNNMSNLIMDIHLTTDHADDGPRLGNLGGISIVTLGIIPLNYKSKWDLTADVSLSKPDGTPVADYVFHETGTYDIWAFPWTPLTLLFAGVRGDSDGKEVAIKTSKSIAKKITDMIDENYNPLSAHVGRAALTPQVDERKFEVPSASFVP